MTFDEWIEDYRMQGVEWDTDDMRLCWEKGFEAGVSEKDAAVVAEREACAKLCQKWSDCWGEGGRDDMAEAAWRCAKHIEAEANTDTLAARDARVRAEALREAMKICDEERHNTNALTSNPPQSAGAVKARNRILALIPADQEEDG